MENQKHDLIEDFLPPEMIGRKIVTVCAGLLLPLILIPIISILNFSEVIEEFSKAIVVGVCILPLASFRNRVFWAALFGFLFGLSETMLFFTNMVTMGDYSLLLYRFLLTIPMHMLTVVIIVSAGSIRKIYILFGFVFAIILHLAFNTYVVQYVSRMLM